MTHSIKKYAFFPALIYNHYFYIRIDIHRILIITDDMFVVNVSLTLVGR